MRYTHNVFLWQDSEVLCRFQQACTITVTLEAVRSDDKAYRSSGASLNLKISAEPGCRGLHPLLQWTAVCMVVDDGAIHILSGVFLNAEYIKVKVL